MSVRTTRIVLMSAAFLTGLVLCASLVLLVVGRVSPPMAQQIATIGGPFQLINQNGDPVSDQDLKGKPFLVFFGFTHCPDVCPTALFEISEVLRAMGKDADLVNAYFISVDPERDTTQAVKEYLSSFDPHLKGLAGNPDQIAKVISAYLVYARKVP